MWTIPHQAGLSWQVTGFSVSGGMSRLAAVDQAEAEGIIVLVADSVRPDAPAAQQEIDRTRYAAWSKASSLLAAPDVSGRLSVIGFRFSGPHHRQPKPKTVRFLDCPVEVGEEDGLGLLAPAWSAARRSRI